MILGTRNDKDNLGRSDQRYHSALAILDGPLYSPKEKLKIDVAFDSDDSRPVLMKLSWGPVQAQHYKWSTGLLENKF